MITDEEEKFYQYWSQTRKTYKTSLRPYLKGLSIGFAIGVGILLTIYQGWYTRANMQANTVLNPYLFLSAISMVAFFMAFIYRNYQWEQQEQRFQIISAKKMREEKNLSNAALGH
jgi:hypothetical protein